jgi:hypothetical protein
MKNAWKMKRAGSMVAATAVAGVFGLALCRAQQPVDAQPAAAADAGKAGEEAAKAVATAPYRSLEDQRATEAEGARLLEKCRAELAARDLKPFTSTLWEIADSYPGDPVPLAEEMWNRLSARQRAEQAILFLRLGLHRSESIEALRAVVRDKGIKDQGGDDYEHSPWSPRVEAARTLGYARAKEAAGDIWALYQERGGKDRDLPFLLADRLGDERPRQLVKTVTVDGDGYVMNVDLLGHYRVAEAVEPLKKQVAIEKALKQSSYRLPEAEVALFLITGEHSYLQAAIEQEALCSLPALAATKTPEAQALLQKLVLAEDHQTQNQRSAFIALFMNYPGDPVVKKTVMEGLDRRGIAQPGLGEIYGDTLTLVAARLHDSEIDAKGQAYYQATGDRSWVKAYYRRDLPLRQYGPVY